MARHWSKAPMGDETEARIELGDITTDGGVWFQVDGYAVVSGEVDSDGEVYSSRIDSINLAPTIPIPAPHNHDPVRVEIDDRHPLWKAIVASITDAMIDEALVEAADDNGTISRRSYAEQVA